MRALLNIAYVHLTIDVQHTPVSAIHLGVRSPSQEPPIACHSKRSRERKQRFAHPGGGVEQTTFMFAQPRAQDVLPLRNTGREKLSERGHQ
ncbi:MAG TPA: hypothetical protein VH164_00080 [Ktedonobacteraceae bacterium]|nr:hypothetical protein [Ktedonobacteraceae bacterium]